jgi:tetratricopeptide (TPR) repeat protein
LKQILKIIYLAFFVFLISSQSLSFSQETKYQPLISGIEEYKAGNYQKALENFLEAEKNFSDDPDISFYLGLTYLQLNQKEKAIEHFKKSIKLDPEYLDAYFMLGLVFIQEKKFSEAILFLEQVFKSFPKKENLGYLLGYSYFNLKNYQKAIYYFERNKTLDKRIEQLNLFYLALCKIYLGETKEVEKIFKKVIEIDPSSPLAQASKQFLAK